MARQVARSVGPRGHVRAKGKEDLPETTSSWTFLTNHAHVLLCIAQNPRVRLSEIARLVGIGERAVHSIVSDLVESGYVTRHREGRRNRYEVDLDRPLRHPLEAGHHIAEVFRPLTRRRRSAG